MENKEFLLSRIKELKGKLKEVIEPTSAYAIEMVIEELEFIKDFMYKKEYPKTNKWLEERRELKEKIKNTSKEWKCLDKNNAMDIVVELIERFDLNMFEIETLRFFYKSHICKKLMEDTSGVGGATPQSSFKKRYEIIVKDRGLKLPSPKEDSECEQKLKEKK